jgi:WD40 repeat protein
MVDKGLWLLLRVCLVALMLLGIGFYPLMYQTIKTSTTQRICLPGDNAIPKCLTRSRKLFDREITAIAVSPNGQWLAGADHNTIHLWDLYLLGKRVKSLHGHHDWVSALVFSSDNLSLASSSLDQTIKLWNLEAGKPYATLKSARMTSLAYSPDGQVLASGSRVLNWADNQTSPGGVQLWQLITRSITRTLGNEAVSALAFSPDGKWLASGNSRIQLWETASGKQRHEFIATELTDLAFTPDSKLLVAAGKNLQAWWVSRGILAQKINSRTGDLAVNPYGKSLVTASGGTLFFWQLLPRRFLGGLRASHYSHVKVAFGMDGTVVSAGSDGVRLWWQ